MSTDNRNNTLGAFYTTGGLRELVPIYPLYAIMFGAHGISAFELSSLFFIWALVGLVTEVPSGAWADTYSRKWIVVASGLFKSLGFLCWFLWQDFGGYALGFVLWGLGSSLRSGAYEALLHDVLARWDESNKFTLHYGRIRSLATFSAMFGEILGGFLIIYGYDLVLVVSMLVPLVATIPFILFVTDVKKDESAAEPDYLAHLKGGVKEAMENKSIAFIFLATTFLIVAYGVYDEYVPPVMFEKGFSLSTVAFLAAPVFMAQALGEFLAYRFSALSFDHLLLLMILGSAFLLPVYWLQGYWVPLVMMGFFFTFGLASTLFASQLQKKIVGASRATVTSLVGLGDSIGAMIWFMIFGAIAEFTSMSGSTSLFTLLIIFACLAARKLLRLWKI